MVQTDVLKKFPFLSDVDERTLGKIAEACSARSYHANELCFAEGQEADDFYLLLRGKVSLERLLPSNWINRSANIHTLGEKDVFGWSALLEPSVLTASAHCLEQCEVVVIKGRDLLDILEGDHRAGHIIMKRLAAIVASRLTDTTHRLLHEMADFESYRTA